MKKIIILVLSCAMAVSLFAQEKAMRVASYNLRYNNQGDGINSWPNRVENVKALIRFHDFDIFGTQEGLIDQLKDLSQMQEFLYTGKGREDGKEAGEHSAIFYKKDRFKLLASGDFWLSATPEKPSVGWDANLKRICSWGKFRDLKLKKEFYFFSVHFDHQGVEARKQSGPLMVKKIKEIAGKNPVILVGDFNSLPETEQIKTISAYLSDAKLVSKMPAYGPEGTTNQFKLDAPMKNRIDYIFTSSPFKILKYGVLTDSKDQRYPSDHLPILADVAY